MSVSIGHVFSQGEVLGGLARTAWSALLQSRKGADHSSSGTGAFAVPGPEIVAVLPPRPPRLVADYVRHVGGDPSSYRATLPPHLFPQWSFGLAARTLEGAPYPLAKVMNAGCKLEVKGPLPANVPLHVRVRLDGAEVSETRAILDQRIVTGTEKDPELLVAHLYAFVPLAKKEAGASKREKPRVPEAVREIAFFRLGPDAGLDFAKLTGDFNPVHWIAPYARTMGFRSTILHGFSTMARAWEGLARGLFAGSTRAITGMDVRFTRPLVLPAKVGLYVPPASESTTNGDARRVWVGDAPGGGAYLEGTFTTKNVSDQGVTR